MHTSSCVSTSLQNGCYSLAVPVTVTAGLKKLTLHCCNSDCAGTYDWSGVLDMQPDPFKTWGFSSINSSASVGRHLLQQLVAAQVWLPTTSMTSMSHDHENSWMHTGRSLLLDDGSAAGGNLPVQGRVSVREALDPNALTAGNPALTPGSVAALDEDISAAYPVPPNPDNPSGLYFSPPPAQAGQPELPQSVQDAVSAFVRALSDPANRKIIILVASLAGSLGGALCAVCVAAGIVYRRRQQKQGKEGKAAEGSQDDITAGQPTDAADQQPPGLPDDPSTDVQALQPGDIHYSVCGAAVVPPSCDGTADGGAPPTRMRARDTVLNNLRGSLSGMAAGVVSAMGIYKSSSGGAAYKVQDPQQPIQGGVLHGSSTGLHWAPALRHREPTLPGAFKSTGDEKDTQQQSAVSSGRNMNTKAHRPAAHTAAVPQSSAAASGQHQQRQRQQQQVVASQWVPQSQATLQGRTAGWATADLHYVHGSAAHNDSLPTSPALGDGVDGGDDGDEGSGGFFLAVDQPQVAARQPPRSPPFYRGLQ